MVDNKKLHHLLARIRRLPHWGFFVAGVILLFVAAFALRANNQHMIELRQAVFAADEQDGDVESALRELREYVYAHMNTDLAAGDNAIKPPIQLKYRYERLVLAENAKLSTSNETIYTDAQNHCEQAVSTGFSGRNRLDCIKEYVDAHGVQTQAVNVPDALYKFDFISPTWSPDLAGWSLVAAALCFVAFTVLFLIEHIIRRRLRNMHH